MAVTVLERPSVPANVTRMRVASIGLSPQQCECWAAHPEKLTDQIVSVILKDDLGRLHDIDFTPIAVQRDTKLRTRDGWIIKGRTRRTRLTILLAWDFATRQGPAIISQA